MMDFASALGLNCQGLDVIVMQYLDARGPDGKTRKYRVMMIDGEIYPLHVAISSHWCNPITLPLRWPTMRSTARRMQRVSGEYRRCAWLLWR